VGNRRRLGYGGIVFAVVVVVVGGALLHHGKGQVSPKRPFPASGRFAINSGMTDTQVLQVAGRPTVKRGDCWRYDAHRPIKYLVKGGGTRNGVLTAMRVCFYTHIVYDVRYQIDGKWSPPDQSQT